MEAEGTGGLVAVVLVAVVVAGLCVFRVLRLSKAPQIHHQQSPHKHQQVEIPHYNFWKEYANIIIVIYQ